MSCLLPSAVSESERAKANPGKDDANDLPCDDHSNFVRVQYYYRRWDGTHDEALFFSNQLLRPPLQSAILVVTICHRWGIPDLYAGARSLGPMHESLRPWTRTLCSFLIKE